MAKTVTTRRIIRPSGDTEAPRVEPPRSEALQQRATKPTTLWGSWQARFASLEQQMALALPSDLERARQPRQADLTEVRRLQAVWLDPWSGLQETFDAAASGTVLSDELLRDYRLFLSLRAAQLRALTRCFLAPTAVSVRQLDETQAAIETFIAARRADS
jgi:hypothetical protein